MKFNRIKLSQESTKKLNYFKIRTGLTPNIACRLALSLSIAEQTKPALELYSDDSGQEINRYTFFGEHELILNLLFQQWCDHACVDQSEYYRYLMAHINRGVEMLTNRVKGVDEFTELIKGQ